MFDEQDGTASSEHTTNAQHATHRSTAHEPGASLSFVTMTNADGSVSILTPLEHDTAGAPTPPTSAAAAVRPPMRVKGIGWVGRTENGDLCVHFEDGTQITLSSNGKELYYIDVCDGLLDGVHLTESGEENGGGGGGGSGDGGPKIYNMDNEHLPLHVKEKLPYLAKAMKALRGSKEQRVTTEMSI